MVDHNYNPALEKNPPRHLLGWWEFDTDTPQKSLANERRIFERMEESAPQRFEAQPARETKNEVVVAQLKKMMADDGYGEGSMDTDYLERLATSDGSNFRWLAQIIGSCVASGGMRVQCHRSLADILVFGDFEETLGTNLTGTNNLAHFAPYSYGQGRRFGGMRGGDGSYCSVHIKGFMEKGWLPCDTPGLQSDAYPEPQNTRTYRAWGNWQYLDEFERFATPFDLIESERITDADRMVVCLRDEFKPAMICSGWGFAPARQHRDGFWVYRRSGSWPHNMSIVGVRVASDGKIFIKVKNSWGMNAHRDGDHFWIEIDLFASWLRSAECRTLGQMKQRSAELPVAW